jgi:hypothetical protein
MLQQSLPHQKRHDEKFEFHQTSAFSFACDLVIPALLLKDSNLRLIARRGGLSDSAPRYTEQEG